MRYLLFENTPCKEIAGNKVKCMKGTYFLSVVFTLTMMDVHKHGQSLKY